jgi:cytochrome b pre-mRNA-processing protein 3
MLGQFLAKKPKAAKPDAAATGALYGAATSLARAPVFYARMGVPDTNDGRFDALCLMLSLFLFRVQRDDAALAQALFDLAFKDMERGLREAGVGDLGVPKHMKRMIQGFYGRSANYYDALDQGDTAALSAVLVRNLYDGQTDAPAAAMAEWVRIMWDYLQAVDLNTLVTHPETIIRLLPPLDVA